MVGWLGSCGGKLKIFLSSSLSAVIAAQVRVMLAMGAVHTRVIVRGRRLHVTSLAAKSISAPGRSQENKEVELVSRATFPYD